MGNPIGEVIAIRRLIRRIAKIVNRRPDVRSGPVPRPGSGNQTDWLAGLLRADELPFRGKPVYQVGALRGSLSYEDQPNVITITVNSILRSG
jgi:hypothetical protein